MAYDEMNTLTSVLNTLKERNIDSEFEWKNNALQAEGKSYTPDKLTYRFEGESNPDDSAILYVLKTNDGIYGFSIDAYGAESNYDEAYDNFIRQISFCGREEQLKFEL